MRSNFRSITPVFLVGDIAATMPWYESVLGCRAEPIPRNPPHAFCILERDDAVIFLQQLDGYRLPDHYRERAGGVWSAYIRTEGVQELFDTLRKREDVQIIQQLRLQPYGQIEFEIRDPNGYVLVFAEEA